MILTPTNFDVFILKPDFVVRKIVRYYLTLNDYLTKKSILIVFMLILKNAFSGLYVSF